VVCVLYLMASKNPCRKIILLSLQHKEDLHNTSHGSINTDKKKYSESISVISVIKLLLHLTINKATDGGL
jgi:hypothetical protein